MRPDTRRQHPRIAKRLDAVWHGAGATQDVRVTDISSGGCFVEARASIGVKPGTAILLTIAGCESPLSGVAAYVDPMIGFGVRFGELSPEAARDLNTLLDALSRAG